MTCSTYRGREMMRRIGGVEMGNCWDPLLFDGANLPTCMDVVDGNWDGVLWLGIWTHLWIPIHAATIWMEQPFRSSKVQVHGKHTYRLYPNAIASSSIQWTHTRRMKNSRSINHRRARECATLHPTTVQQSRCPNTHIHSTLDYKYIAEPNLT